MARWLLDCEPLCGHPWRLGLASDADELDRALRLRYTVFAGELGYTPPTAGDGRDRDPFDDWCDHLIVADVTDGRVIATGRAIRGAEAVRRGGFYAADEFDLTPLTPVAAKVLQGGRTCVAAEYRTGPAIQYLSYGMELLLRETGCEYFLGAESVRPDAAAVDRTASYLAAFATDPDWHLPPHPACEVPGLRPVAVTPADERHLPGVIRLDVRMGFLACGPPAWDRRFGSYDFLMLGRRDRLTRLYETFLARITRPARPR